LKVVAEYPTGWLLDKIDADGQKQARGRADPKKAGQAACVGDIGTHAENLGRYITGLKMYIREFTSFIPAASWRDDATCLIRYKGGAKGVAALSLRFPAARKTHREQVRAGIQERVLTNWRRSC